MTGRRKSVAKAGRVVSYVRGVEMTGDFGYFVVLAVTWTLAYLAEQLPGELPAEGP